MSEALKLQHTNMSQSGLSLEEALRYLTSHDPRFEFGSVRIRGVNYNAFTAVPASIRDFLAVARTEQAHGDFLVFGDRCWSYEEFLDDVEKLGGALQKKLAVGKGQPVAIAMQNRPEMLIAFMAITSIGAVAVFVNAWWTTQELDYAMRDSGARLVLADQKRADRLAPLSVDVGFAIIGVGIDGADVSYEDLLALDHAIAPVAIDTDDDMSIMYSSGTTGHPKGVVHTHRSAINAVYTWLMQTELLRLRAPTTADAPKPLRPCFMVITPLFHVTASHASFLFSVAAGAKLVLMDKWNAEDAVQLIDRHQVTRFVGVPTQSAELIGAAQRRGSKLPSLSTIGSGGAKQPPAQVAKVKTAFPHVQPATGWGMTETNALGFGITGPDYVTRPNASGRLYPPLQEIRFVNDDSREVPVGEVGEIIVKSPCNMRCYLNKAEATAEILQDGWLRTGDMGMIDSEGIITIVDRKKNIIVRGGENIACLDVEAALHRHPAVVEACVFPVPDDRLGEVVGAALYLSEPLAEDDLRAFLGGHIAQFKIPTHIWTFDEPLPRGATGKIDSRSLRATCLLVITSNEAS